MEGKKFQKSYFDVLGICCPSEIPLIVNILKPLDGVIEVNVIVPSRTVIVIHDDHIISQIQIVKALNSARLEANVRVYGEENSGNKWPKPYTIACGVLVAISTFKFLYHPLQWVGIAAVAVGIPPVLLRSIASIRSCSQNYTMDVNILVLIAVIGAVALGDYWEAGTVVFLFTIAEWLELRATQKANTVMSSLMSMAPQKAILAETGEAVDAKDVKIDTILAVKAGEVIPIDGIVVEGNCEVDEKSLTGESMPASKQTQSTVWAGTINLNGYISVRTTALAEDCVVAKMAKLVEEAQNSKSKSQRLVDKFAKYYTPAVMIASVSLVIVPAAMRKHNLKHWVHLALVVLVSACPCALILSTPIATFCAFTKAATSGILVKGGDYLETLAKIKTLAFDKTGTITRGEFLVTDFRSLRPDISLETLLYWVSSIESKASHPMAASLVDYAQLSSIEPRPENVKDFQNFPGEGIHGEIDGKSIYVGNRRIARRAGCDKVPPPGDDKEGGTFGYIISGEDLLGEFRMADTCRSGVLDAIKELKSLGIKTIMLTGDSQIAAMQVQEKLGHALDEIHAELLPEDKVRIIKDHKRDGPTAMIGDGVNDAPALATADIGISMGISGSALATETGHITLMSNDIRKVPQAIRLARQTLWKIRQNVGLSFVTKAAILTLAFCGHPILWAAVLADVGTCLLVIFNSMLILQGTTKHKRIHKSSCSKKGNGHASHNGCGHSTHDKHEHGHGAKHEHGHGAKHVHKPCCNTNHVQEKTCAHADPTSTCGQKKVQTCTSRSSCKTADSAGCGKGNVCSGDETLLQSESSDRKCCGSGTVGHESPSHVIQINEIERVETCENHSNDEVLCGLTNRDECSTTSHQTKKPCQGHPTSEDDGHDHHHHHHHHHDLHRHLSEKPCQGHATSEDNGHGNDHHHHHHHHHHDHHQHDHHHHQRAIPLNDGIKTTTTTMYGGCLHNRCRTCILPDTSIIIA